MGKSREQLYKEYVERLKNSKSTSENKFYIMKFLDEKEDIKIETRLRYAADLFFLLEDCPKIDLTGKVHESKFYNKETGEKRVEEKVEHNCEDTKNKLVKFFKNMKPRGFGGKKENKRKKFTDNTIASKKLSIKTYLRWLHHCDKDDKPPMCASWIKTKGFITNLPRLFTEEEIEKLVETAKHPRDKCFVYMLFDTGARIKELLQLKVEDVIETNSGMQFTVFNKGKPYTSAMIDSIPYYNRWKAQHPHYEPGKTNPPLFPSISRKSVSPTNVLCHSGSGKLLKNLAEKAGFKGRKIYHHLLRHSRCLNLKVVHGMSDDMVMARIQHTTHGMLRHYGQINSEIANEFLARKKGLIKEEKREIIAPIRCKICNHLNPSTQRKIGTCENCGKAITQEYYNKELERMREREQTGIFTQNQIIYMMDMYSQYKENKITRPQLVQTFADLDSGKVKLDAGENEKEERTVSDLPNTGSKPPSETEEKPKVTIASETGSKQ